MKNEGENNWIKAGKMTLKAGRWIIKPELENFNEPTREVMVCAGTLIGGFGGALTYVMAGALKAFDWSTSLYGSSSVPSITPEFVESIINHPFETVVSATAMGLSVGSYIALAGKSIPPRNPDVWKYDVWDLKSIDQNKK
jgi:hypothetical protein